MNYKNALPRLISVQQLSNMLFELAVSHAYLLLATLIPFFALRWKRSPRPLLPPGPKSLPFVGNMLQMPVLKPWEKYGDWAKKYGMRLFGFLLVPYLALSSIGDIVFLDLPSQPTLIISSAKVAFDLMEKRPQIYSDRIPLVMDKLSVKPNNL